MNEDLMLILKHYGIERQSLQACEELAELIQAVSKMTRKQDYRLIDNLIEEIADSKIMLRQLMLFYGINDFEVEAVAKSKILRQMERINGEGINNA